MSLEHQVALARTTRGESSHLSKAARQVVPPFLQKLYECADFALTEVLGSSTILGMMSLSAGQKMGIRSTYSVLNHERFAREVLGRWFKHQKFTSFVRQLNMYGFHKIPHLQQGVLKSDTDTEPWNFEHPHFHRGQPDLLCLIQRKKQPANNADEADLSDAANPSASVNGTPGQVLDINTIVNGIAAIKRHQQAISADLNALKKSNDLLWEEATLTRQRHDKQQDTINRILKFLAGVFGHTSESIHKTDDGRSPGVVPRARQRLMIGDGRLPKGKTVEVADVDDDDDGDFMNQAAPPQEGTNSPLAGQISSVGSPAMSAMSPAPSTAPSETFSPVSANSVIDSTPPGYTARPTRPAEVLSRTSAGTGSNHGSTTEMSPRTTPTVNRTPPVNNMPRSDAALSPSTMMSFAPSTPGPNHLDGMWQAAIQQVLNNPVQMQRLMQALAATQQNVGPMADNPPVNHQDTMAQLAPYTTSANTYNDYNRYRHELPVAAPMSHASLPVLNPSMPHGDEAAPLEPLLDNVSRLQKTYRDTVEIEADMDMLQNSLHTLINDLGMDPQALMSQAHENRGGLPMGGYANGHGQPQNGEHASGLPNGMRPNGMHQDASLMPNLDGHREDPSSDLFLETLLNGMSGSNGNLDFSDVTDHYDPSTRIIDGTTVGDASTDQLTSFLDEVSDTATPVARSTNMTPLPQKRKSDMAGLRIPPSAPEDHSTAASHRTKRKR
ncbi:uncharacterized protein LAESUDRAFT_718183 [Laetiporus sulphureus 93-53]|uniref:HSF-type DNA-binding domain-containing protein n=1 Tax=Laetiporus sulphureus 93-53 TaxID=1314785 RepID=A0A165B6Z0_9APHY|nr:uncharacterized protein LAESUDRAFT_718183 [Laetiporus sulphureus 93-53]KZT00387.1 hypothetical protein LAESUDRAFT_718183 [Laetiporus sulphureus 93-53]